MTQRRNTIWMAAGILILSLAGLCFQQMFLKKEGSFAVVQVSGQEIYRLDLQKETEFVLEETGYNKIVVEDGAVAVTEADCPDQICVRTGRIHTAGEVIACLPHETIITIEGEPGRQDAAVQ